MNRNVLNAIVLLVVCLCIYSLLDEFFKRSSKNEHVTPNTLCIQQLQNTSAQLTQLDMDLCNIDDRAPQFAKFIWVVSDGWPRAFADDLFAFYRSHSIGYSVQVPGLRLSHAIYISWFTGESSMLHWMSTSIATYNLWDALFDAGFKIDYVGKEKSMMGIIGKERAQRFTSIHLVPEVSTTDRVHSYLFQNLSGVLEDSLSRNTSLFAFSALYDTKMHKLGWQHPQTQQLSNQLQRDLQRLKEFIDTHPEYLLIISTDHGVDGVGNLLHGHTMRNNNGFFLLYNPRLPSSLPTTTTTTTASPFERDIDVVDVAPTLVSYLQHVDIPATSVGMSQAEFHSDHISDRKKILAQNLLQLHNLAQHEDKSVSRSTRMLVERMKSVSELRNVSNGQPQQQRQQQQQQQQQLSQSQLQPFELATIDIQDLVAAISELKGKLYRISTLSMRTMVLNVGICLIALGYTITQLNSSLRLWWQQQRLRSVLLFVFLLALYAIVGGPGWGIGLWHVKHSLGYSPDWSVLFVPFLTWVVASTSSGTSTLSLPKLNSVVAMLRNNNNNNYHHDRRTQNSTYGRQSRIISVMGQLHVVWANQIVNFLVLFLSHVCADIPTTSSRDTSAKQTSVDDTVGAFIVDYMWLAMNALVVVGCYAVLYFFVNSSPATFQLEMYRWMRDWWRSKQLVHSNPSHPSDTFANPSNVHSDRRSNSKFSRLRTGTDASSGGDHPRQLPYPHYDRFYNNYHFSSLQQQGFHVGRCLIVLMVLFELTESFTWLYAIVGFHVIALVVYIGIFLAILDSLLFSKYDTSSSRGTQVHALPADGSSTPPGNNSSGLNWDDAFSHHQYEDCDEEDEDQGGNALQSTVRKMQILVEGSILPLGMLVFFLSLRSPWNRVQLLILLAQYRYFLLPLVAHIYHYNRGSGSQQLPHTFGATTTATVPITAGTGGGIEVAKRRTRMEVQVQAVILLIIAQTLHSFSVGFGNHFDINVDPFSGRVGRLSFDLFPVFSALLMLASKYGIFFILATFMHFTFAWSWNSSSSSPPASPLLEVTSATAEMKTGDEFSPSVVSHALPLPSPRQFPAAFCYYYVPLSILALMFSILNIVLHEMLWRYMMPEKIIEILVNSVVTGLVIIFYVGLDLTRSFRNDNSSTSEETKSRNV